MKQKMPFILFFTLAVLLVGCGKGQSVKQSHLDNTPYQLDSVLETSVVNPERALTLLDSALCLGNISDYRGRFIRARIYSKSLMWQRQDSAILICEKLLDHDSVMNDPGEQENILDILITTSRAKHDSEAYLQWATQKATLCQKQGLETERWRTEADIGLVMTYLGEVEEGLVKLDEAISHLDAFGSLDRMDAFIVAIKRKINALNDLHRFDEVIPLAQRILDRLDHYEQHAKDYAEDSYRLSWSDNPTDRHHYLDFSRAQAWAFMAHAAPLSSPHSAANTSPRGEDGRGLSLYCLSLYNQTDYGKTFAGRRLIAPTQMALGMYDEAMATYDELERRMGGDTLNDDYAIILRARAIAARAKGRIAEALDYQTRYANLLKAVSDSQHQSEAHDYAARYHAQEQQLEIREKEAEADRSRIVSIAVAAVALLAIAFAVYFFRQKRVVTEKNRALVRMINEQTKESASPLASRRADGGNVSFNDIDTAIRSERLYSNATLQRQDICARFNISRHVLNELLSQNVEGLSFPQYVNNIRLEVAIHLLREDPSKTVSAIATEVGFTPANLREQFKRKYGMTPADYRQNL